MVRKSKKGPAISKARIRARKRERRLIDEARKRALEKAGAKNRPLLESEGPKLSALIMELAEPLLKAAESVEHKIKAINLAVLAWNISFYDKEKFEQFCSGYSWNEDMIDIFIYLRRRRQTLFSEENRIVVSYEIVETRKSIHLTVVSSVINDDFQTEISNHL